MPWWAWVLIWLVLALALCAMFGVVGVVLFRKGRELLTEVEALTSILDLLGRPASNAAGEGTDSAFVPAVLRPWREVASDRDRVREAAQQRRDSRRDARVDRGRALTRVDATKRSWFDRP